MEPVSDMDIINPQPVLVKIGRSNNLVEVEIFELVLRQYDQLFKVFGGILGKLIASGSVDFSNVQSALDWKAWLPNLISEAGEDVKELLRIALEKDMDIIDQITMKQLPEVLTKIIEVNGLEQIILGFRKLSAMVVAEMVKRNQVPSET